MLNFLLGAGINWSDPTLYILIGLLVVLVVMMFFRFKQSKKAQAEQVNLLDNLKVGDKVTTHIGVYGTIVKIVETTNGKVFTIQTGDKNKSELDLDYRYIAALDNKEVVTYDANGNVITPESKKADLSETKVEPETKSEVGETLVDGEAEPKKKTRTKKSKNSDEFK